MEVAGSSTTGLDMTPEVALTATKMGRVPLKGCNVVILGASGHTGDIF